MRRLLGAALLLAGALLLALLLLPGPIDPAAWSPPPPPALAGPLAANRALARVELLGAGRLHGPEADAIGRYWLDQPAARGFDPAR